MVSGTRSSFVAAMRGAFSAKISPSRGTDVPIKARADRPFWPLIIEATLFKMLQTCSFMMKTAPTLWAVIKKRAQNECSVRVKVWISPFGSIRQLAQIAS